MIGIRDIGVYIPAGRSSNYARKDQFNIDDDFIEKKLGITQVAVKGPEEKASDMAVRAFDALSRKCGLDKSLIDCLIVVTQNPDNNLPHTSAIVHAKLDLMPSCACFDISLGCSGFVYGLSVIESFMESNSLNHGVLITAEPYSTIIDRNDKNTSLLFGDAATATLIDRTPRFVSGKYTFGTVGKSYGDLIAQDNKLFMNGRSIFDFAARQVPLSVKTLLEKNDQRIEQVDKFIFHQGSNYIHQTILNRLGIDPQKAPFGAREYGNTVSSSIPILLEREIENTETRSIVICGFGVGLSWASGILLRTHH
jgi:3-oxoacyl-[acyl-carrier-protein] synthase-3